MYVSLIPRPRTGYEARSTCMYDVCGVGCPHCAKNKGGGRALKAATTILIMYKVFNAGVVS